ncbi:kinase-like domain-containing protein [Chaetomium tenue]|uniref:Kinase-like domain-containing protein n=1 Tax=Chaetomium tenue TaxID=1854479 RepID=A0ACB7P3M6_9PEZI|nr:kinase-like domain-containing protein [Chaetomium globosum]
MALTLTMSDIPLIPASLTGIPWTCGLSGAIFFVSDRAVIKRPFSDDESSKEQLRVERRIYARLGNHPRITAFLGSQQDTIILERLHHTLRHRLLEMRKLQQRPTMQQVTMWALQTAEGLDHIHSHGVKQVDIGTYNVLLDRKENAKVSDFAGSSLDGSAPTVAPSVHSAHPSLSTMEPTVQSELFALGSLLYEVETTHRPFDDKTEEDVEALFGSNQYPTTSELVLVEVIRKCWAMTYSSASEVVADIKVIQEHVDGN